MELSNHTLGSGWIAAGYTDDEGRFHHVATLRPGSTDEEAKVATLKAMGAFETFVMAVQKFCKGLPAFFAAAREAIAAPKVGEKWHVRLPTAVALTTIQIGEITDSTVVVWQPALTSVKVRYALRDVEFIERVEE